MIPRRPRSWRNYFKHLKDALLGRSFTHHYVDCVWCLSSFEFPDDAVFIDCEFVSPIEAEAARAADELKVLREYAREGDGIQCEYCDTVCIPGTDDSEDWNVLGEEGDTMRLCYHCSRKACPKEDLDAE